MMIDHVYDELVLKQHFSPVNAIHMFVRELNDRSESFNFKFSLVVIEILKNLRKRIRFNF